MAAQTDYQHNQTLVYIYLTVPGSFFFSYINMYNFKFCHRKSKFSKMKIFFSGL